MKLHGTMTINQQGHLSIGGCDTVELGKEFGTPLYIIDETHLRKTCQAFYQAFVADCPQNKVLYASKAFLTKAMAKIIQEEKLGLDIVSGGELFTAQEVDFPPEQIYFHGNNKSATEIEKALDYQIGYFVVDNCYELELLDNLCRQKKRKASILLRISPGIEAETHKYIQTGQLDSKFGLPISTGQALAIVQKALTLDHLLLKGIHCHIGSQIFTVTSFRQTAEIMMDFLQTIKEETGQELSELNLGGGFGIYYQATDTPAPLAQFAQVIRQTVAQKARKLKIALPKIIIEPGRSIIGNAGTTLYTIGSIKRIPQVRTYVAVDGGMTDNLRPALYQAKYEAALANKMLASASEMVSIAGKCCESGDMLIWDLPLPTPLSGDLLAVSCTGAYNYSMSSNYNRLPRPAVVLVQKGQADLIVARETEQDLIKNDLLPPRLIGKNR